MESSAASRRPSTLCRADAKGKADKKSISPPPTECQPPPLPCPRECRNPSHPSPLANTNPPTHPSPRAGGKGRMGDQTPPLPPPRCPRACGDPSLPPRTRTRQPIPPLAHAGTHPPFPSSPLPNRPRPHPSPLPNPPQTIPSYKSNHLGLPFSTNRTFHARYHFFRVFSLTLALSIDS